MSYEFRAITPDEFIPFARAGELVFGEVSTDEQLERAREGFELDRSVAAFDRGKVVSTSGVMSFQQTLPGLTTVPAGGITWVTVMPTHRRKGILTEMMRRMLNDVRDRGELLALLYASESSIYERFGFGLSTLNAEYEIDPHYASLAHDVETPGTVAILHKEEAQSVIPAVYERYRCMQPAELSRNEQYWNGWLADYPEWRDGMSARVFATYESAAGSIDGYVAYRLDGKWDDGFPNGRLSAGVVAAITDEARAGLWKFLLGQDLVRHVTVRGLVHEPVRYMLAEPRRLRMRHLTDGLWTRVVDVPRALEARRYATDDAFVLQIDDSFMPENTGRYALEGGPQGATCRPSTESPDLSMSIADLGAIFQGGIPLTTLTRAGRIQEETSGAARRAEAFFESHPEPLCMTHF